MHIYQFYSALLYPITTQIIMASQNTFASTSAAATASSAMDSYANCITYTVYEVTHDGLTLPSTFLSKKDAYRFVKDYTDSSSNVYVFKTKCVRTYSARSEDSETLEAANTLAAMKSHKTSSKGTHYVTLVDPDYNSDEDPDYVPDEHDDFGLQYEDDYVSDGHEDGDISLEGMFVRAYGKGYLLVPTSDCEFFGQKYFLEGWWMPSQKGWFFKAEFLDTLTNLGAMYVTKSGKSVKTKTRSASKTLSTSAPVSKTRSGKTRASSAPASSHTDLSHMALSTYGKGYLLTTVKSHPHYAKYYYSDTHGFSDTVPANGTYTHLGYWNSNGNGWFFRKSSFTYLTSVAGVKFIKDEPTASTSSFTMSEDLSSMNLTHYGKGYLLTPSSGDSRSGTKYFDLPDGGQGWWRQDLGGWFFRSMYYDELVDMGAQFTTQNNTDDSYDIVSTDEQFDYSPNFVKYGKGWLLKTDDKFVYDDSKKYFEGAWWMPSADGWFFRTNAKKLFMKKYGYA